VTIPDWLPTSLNKLMRMHWAQRGRTLKVEAKMITTYARAAGVSKATGKRRVEICIVRAGRDKERDSDSSEKGIRDHLTACGALVDDNPQWLEMAPLRQSNGTRRSTVITIEDLP
jgi:hypothetical protein